MMNSTATLFTFDIYKKYVRPDASEQRLIWVGRVAMMLMVAAAIWLSLYFGQAKDDIFQPHGGLQRLSGAGRARGVSRRYLTARRDSHWFVCVHPRGPDPVGAR